ncbi:THAP domain-containing protein 2-like [Ornithodoros turicata]|uniref:THAP domain-containing protein 2-like n=1 Tax=Ornithodoros turicata TaxID=34597 RepID=UPI00313A48A1
MPTYCCAPWCTLKGNRSDNGKKVSFHCIPEDPQLRKAWLIAIKRRPPFNIRTARVCSNHFKDNDFLVNIASGRRLLRDGAVPSVFPFKKQCKARKPPRTRSVPGNESSLRTIFPENCPAPEDRENENPVQDDNMESVSYAASEPTDDSAESEKDRKIHQLCEELRAARDKIVTLERRADLLTEKCRQLERASAEFSLNKYKDNNDDFQFYTGLPSYYIFKQLLDYLQPHSTSANDEMSNDSSREMGRPAVLTTENQLFLVLVYLRLGLFQKDVGHRFNIHQSTVSRIVNEWINISYLRL